ncbi:hypothetical protein [Aromatoleum petrolei]|uniref:Lipoprotein n=1 Tax=Aromatoleum petrolei TaxID=76116 RepID=A0ABX1MTN3_9RHOO|nr:hypothetical protein [Aromatoleum petrolei]NMF89685.1 hypothetical protein [Aromatoleum petrolei]QTQ36572.1 Uncharacterized protein ToN1_24330 [Aromatoleum petrolei]
MRRLHPAVRALALAALALLGACATPPERKTEPAATTPSPAQSAAEAEPERALQRGRLKPMPVRPLSVKTDCHFKDEVGYGGSAVLDVSYSEVRAFAATVDVPKRGSCKFDLADFRQVLKEPHVELQARDGCTVRMWEQGEQVTVAFSECAKRCTRGTFEYVWPILVDRSSGQCT